MSTQTQTPEMLTASTVAVALQEAQELMRLYAERYARRAQLKADAAAAMEPLTKELDSLTAALNHWADNNKAAFGGKKMLKVEGGEFGFRLGLKKLGFALDMPADKYLNTVRKVLPTAIEETVNGRSIIQAWELVPEVAKQLGKLGVEVKQGEDFIITLKK